MAKKAELEADFIQYEETLREIRCAHQSGDYPKAVKMAVSALDHVDGMMQYERRYLGQKDRETIRAIDVLLKYAPLWFDSESLEKIESLLKTHRRIDKNTSADIAASLTEAKELMWDAHRMWDYLETRQGVRQDELRANLGGDQDRWRWIAETWERLGYLNRLPEGGSYRLTLATRLDEQVRGKCPTCGVVGKATKARLLEQIQCPKCRSNVYFVFLRDAVP